MRRVSLFLVLSPFAVPGAAYAAATCPTGYVSVDMPDVEIAATCGAGYTSAGVIDDCSTGAGVCAVADINCEPGYYLNNGECTICPWGNYCPGDNARHRCPSDVDYPGLQIASWDNDAKSVEGCTKVEQCLSDNSPIESARHGTLVRKCFYNPANGKYELNCGLSTTVYNWVSCDAGYYWSYDGGAYYECFDSVGNCSGCEICDCIPVGTGFYSPADTRSRTKCPDGYTTRTETAGAASECTALCGAGATMLHVWPYTFNLYPDSACERPAIHIGLDGGTCCAHLVPGEVSGAMHVRYNGTVYHTVN